VQRSGLRVLKFKSLGFSQLYYVYNYTLLSRLHFSAASSDFHTKVWFIHGQQQIIQQFQYIDVFENSFNRNYIARKKNQIFE